MNKKKNNTIKDNIFDKNVIQGYNLVRKFHQNRFINEFAAKNLARCFLVRCRKTYDHRNSNRKTY